MLLLFAPSYVHPVEGGNEWRHGYVATIVLSPPPPLLPPLAPNIPPSMSAERRLEKPRPCTPIKSRLHPAAFFPENGSESVGSPRAALRVVRAPTCTTLLPASFSSYHRDKKTPAGGSKKTRQAGPPVRRGGSLPEH